jgi:hypothetical protein
MAAASAPEEIRDLARVSNFMVFLLGFEWHGRNGGCRG